MSKLTDNSLSYCLFILLFLFIFVSLSLKATGHFPDKGKSLDVWQSNTPEEPAVGSRPKAFIFRKSDEKCYRGERGRMLLADLLTGLDLTKHNCFSQTCQVCDYVNVYKMNK